MKLQNVISQRFTTDKSYWQIVFEWEDVFAKELSLTLSKDNKLRCNKIIRHIPWVSNIITTRKTSLLLWTTAHSSQPLENNSTQTWSRDFPWGVPTSSQISAGKSQCLQTQSTDSLRELCLIQTQQMRKFSRTSTT